MTSPSADTPAHGMTGRESPDTDALAQLAELLDQLGPGDTAPGEVAGPDGRPAPDLAQRLDRLGLGDAPFEPAPPERNGTDREVGSPAMRGGRRVGDPTEPGPANGVAAAVDALLDRAPETARSTVLELVRDARPTRPAVVSDVELTRATAFWPRLLEQVGAQGVELTDEGYLPSTEVAALVEALGITGTSTGPVTAEQDVVPLLELRRTAQQLGLVRTRRGRLVVSPDAWAVRADPAALWRLVAARLPIGDDEAERDAGVLALLVLAGGTPRADPEELVASVMNSIGWTSGHVPVTASDVSGLTRPTINALFPGLTASTETTLLRALARDALAVRP